METLSTVQALSNLAYVLLGLASLRLWWRSRSEQAAWVAVAFTVTAAIVLLSEFQPADGWPLLVTKLVVLGLLVLPTALHRFVVSMEGISSRLRWALDGFVGVLALVALAMPRFPEPDEETSAAFGLFVLAFMAMWGLLTGRVAWRLLRASRGMPGVVRTRLRCLAAASVGLALALLVPAGGGGEVAELAGALSGAASGLLFLVAVAPPRSLRMRWREREDAAFHRSTAELMTASTADEVAEIVLPLMVDLVGARSGRIVTDEGTTRSRVGPDESLDPDSPLFLELDLTRGDRLQVQMSPYAPLLGGDERDLLLRLVGLVDLAIDRAARMREQEAARRAAERANREMEAFVATITHDLRNPLTAISGMADLLDGPLAEEVGERAASFVQRIRTNAEYMTGMVRDILALAEINATTPEHEPVDLGMVASLVREELSLRQGPQGQASVVVGALPVVVGDETHFRRLFDNVVSNAVKHAGRPDVAVTITSRDRPDGVEISFQDNGRGIAEDDAERVFGLFEQLEGSEGSGLGLAICQKLVEGIGGRLWFAPSQVGADLRVFLPRSVVASTPGRLGAKAAEAEVAAAGERDS